MFEFFSVESIDFIIGKGGAFAAFIVPAIKIWQAASDTYRRGKKDSRKDIKIIRELADAAGNNQHNIIIESLYQASFNDRSLSAREILFLLSLPAPHFAIRDYKFTKGYIEFHSNDGGRLCFKHFWRSKSRRKRANILFNFIYFACAAAALSPLFAIQTLMAGGVPYLIGAMALTLAFFGPLAYAGLSEGSRIVRSERLLDQYEETSRRKQNSPS